MREILAFSEWRISTWRNSTWRISRKSSRKATTRTGKFAAAFGARTESNAATPLMRQSTFSSSPRPSSGAGKTAVTKQTSLSEGIESKISLKILNSKMSFRLRRPEKSKEKKSSGDELSDMESSDSKVEKMCSSSSDMAFELENIRFEKVGESYIKHEKIREETIEDTTPSPVQIVDVNDIEMRLDNQSRKTSSNKMNNINNNDNKNNNSDNSKETDKTKTQESVYNSETQLKKVENTESVDSIKEDGITINGNLRHTTSFNDDNVNALKLTLEHFILKPEPVYATINDPNRIDGKDNEQKAELQCPTFEIMPPSRRSSFDPPRSPYLENLRSPCETDPEIMNLNRLDSAGDSFELVDTDRNHESR